MRSHNIESGIYGIRAMKEALFYKSANNGTIDCLLCPNRCHIANNERGECKVRRNVGGKLVAENYGKISSVHLDPIEKKPLYHFFPGRSVLSIGSIGCNLHCSYCQNCDISQASTDDYPWSTSYSPELLVQRAAEEQNNIGLAFTYNEPTIFYEFMRETACLAKVNDLQNVMVTNGYINQGPLEELFPFIDAFNIDVKAFTNDFYKTVTGGELAPVKATVQKVKKENKHLEITYLVIPKLNDRHDSFEELVNWIADELGPDTVLHISRYFPAYRSDISATPLRTIEEFFDIANESLDYVYLGNVNKSATTICPVCGHSVINRNGYNTELTGLTENGSCITCGEKIIIT